jgi:hypothetical protein
MCYDNVLVMGLATLALRPKYPAWNDAYIVKVTFVSWYDEKVFRKIGSVFKYKI